MGLKAPNFYRKDAENERSYFLGSGGVLFREFSWVCFGLGFFVVVVCGVLVDLLWWYLCICLPSRSPLVSCILPGWLLVLSSVQLAAEGSYLMLSNKNRSILTIIEKICS